MSNLIRFNTGHIATEFVLGNGTVGLAYVEADVGWGISVSDLNTKHTVGSDLDFPSDAEVTGATTIITCQTLRDVDNLQRVLDRVREKLTEDSK